MIRKLMMVISRLAAGVTGVVLLFAPCIRAQQAAKPPAPPPDVLVLSSGETLMGHFVGAKSGSVTFHNEALGDVTLDWSKIRELHTHDRYAVILKSLAMRPAVNVSRVPVGVVDMTNQTLTVNPGNGLPPQGFAVGYLGQVMAEAEFAKDVRSVSLYQAWKGTLTGGATLVQATQQSRTFTGAVNLVRTIPEDTSLASRNRTTLDFTATDGYLVQPGSPSLKTNIWHADAERDQYLPGSRLFGFVQAAFDHNYSQGLSLQQDYGGGFGWTAIKTTNETLDLKVSVNYLQQSFEPLGPGLPTSPNQNLIGSVFSEDFTRKFARGMTFTEGISATPAWNNTQAYQWAANAALTIPVYKRLSFTMSITNNFLNDPPPGFRKNSFQFTTGVTYTL